MGTAHSDPSQGKCLQLFNPLSFFSSFVSARPWYPNHAVCLVVFLTFSSTSFSVHPSLPPLCTERGQL